MKIAMLGSGATGSVFAAYLKLGGAEMTLVDRYKEHMDKVAKDGLLLVEADTGKETLIQGFKTAYTPENIGVMDIVIVMSKTTNTREILEASKNAIGPETVVVSLQNGIGNAEVLNEFVPANRVMYGSGGLGTELPEPGKCVSKPLGSTSIHFGALENSELTEKAGKFMEKCFLSANCEASFDEDVRFFAWNKACINITGNALQGVVGFPAGFFLDGEGKTLQNIILREACDVANALGVDGDTIYDVVSGIVLPPVMHGYFTSTAQDMLIYKRETEIDSLNGAVVEFGKKLGIATPCNDMLTRMVRLIQDNYSERYKW